MNRENEEDSIQNYIYDSWNEMEKVDEDINQIKEKESIN